jgi:iron complex outermembrane recepter protein
VGVFIDQRRNNIGTLEQDGLDVDVRYRFPTVWGDINVGIAHSEIFHIKQQSFPSNPVLDVVDTFGNPVGSRGRANIGWRYGPWSANAFYNYGGRYLNTAVVPNVKVKSQKTVDAGVAYTAPDGDSVLSGIRVALNAQNLFDEEPPIVINGTSSWDNTTASAIGRFVSIEITKSW